jgi:2-methylcitrate dehydratase PrpD
VCYRAHRAIDAMLGLLHQHPVAPAEVEEVRVSFSNSHLVILKNHAPTTALAAKFSIEFALACALLARRVGLRDLTDTFVRSAAVRRLMARVAIDINPIEEAGTSGYAPYDCVEIKRTDGTVLKSEQVRYAKGDPQAPLSGDDLWAKFEDCVTWSKLKLNARKIFTQLHSLDKLASANDLFPRRASLKRRSRAK